MYILGRTGRVQLHNACAHGHWRACEYAARARSKVNTVVFIWRLVVPRLQMVYVTSQGTLIKSSCKAPTTPPLPRFVFITLNCIVSNGAALILITFCLPGSSRNSSIHMAAGASGLFYQPALLN